MKTQIDFLDSLKLDFELMQNNSMVYKKNVDGISDFFNLKKHHRFESKLLPAGFSGRFNQKNNFVMFGLNPGLIRKFNEREELYQMTDWESYIKARKNLYLFFKEIDHPSDYYKKFWLLFSELVKDSSEFTSKWDFYDQNLTNLNLFPYHSNGFSISKKLTNEQFEYLKTKFEIILRFIQKHKPRLYLFNGKPWEVLLINYKIVKNYEKIQVNNKFSMYFFKLGGTPAVLFEKFFPKHFWLNNHHRKHIIPKMIKDYYKRDFF